MCTRIGTKIEIATSSVNGLDRTEGEINDQIAKKKRWERYRGKGINLVLW